MTIIEQAEELRQKAIGLLLAEQEKITAQLAQLGYGQETMKKKRGRPSLANRASLPEDAGQKSA